MLGEHNLSVLKEWIQPLVFVNCDQQWVTEVRDSEIIELLH